MKNFVYIITGTTKGLGKEIENILLLQNKQVISINRGDADLSKPKILASYLQSLKQKINNEYRDSVIVFVNNAATLGAVSPMSDVKPLEIINTIGTNLTSPILMCNFLFSLTCDWKYFNITSGAAKSKNKYLGLYSITKLGLEEYLEFMKLERENTNCKGIYNFDPKIIATNMNNQLRENCFFNNERFKKTQPKDVETVAKEFCDFVESKLA